MTYFKEYLQLHFIVFLWGFTAILGLMIETPVVEMVFYRVLIASVALSILMMFTGENFAISKVSMLKIMGTGFLFAFHWILFFTSARLSNASVSLVGFATCPFWTSLIEPLVRKKKIKLYEVFLGLTALLGIYLIFQFESKYALGITLAIASAIIAAVFAVLNKQFTETHNHYTITFYEMLGASISIALFFPVYQWTFSETGVVQLLPSSSDWLFIGILALVCTVYPVAQTIKLMKKISAYSVSLTLNMEPVYGIMLALIIFGDSERMGTGFYLGSLVIMLSVISYPLINRFYQRGPLPIDNLR